MVASLQPPVAPATSAVSYPYQPDHQVELLHLQAEIDALMVQLQATQGGGEARAVSRVAAQG